MLWGEKSRGLKKKKRKNERIKGGKKNQVQQVWLHKKEIL